MRSALQLLGGVAVAGVVAAGSTAFTASGLTWGGSNGATATQFVGGTLTQTVVGAVVTNVAYLTDGTGTHTTSIAVTVTGANGKYLTLTPAGGTFSTTGAGDPTTATGWSCTDGTATVIYHASAPKFTLASNAATVTCQPAVSTVSIGGYYGGLTGLDIAVTLV